jgi:5,10-methylenetetrahydrofolate reductase
MQPNVTKVYDRFGDSLLTIELNPPEKDQLNQQMDAHRSHLTDLFDTVPEVGGINLPEIQEEEQKGDRGDRKSDFKDRLSPREYTRKLQKRFEKEFVINRVIVQLPPENQENWLLETYHKYDVKSIVVVGGESSEETYPGPSVTDGNTLIKKHLNEGNRLYGTSEIEPTDYLIGNICISTRRRDGFDEPDRMARKIETGCDFFASQIIAESETPGQLLKDLAPTLEESNLDAPAILWSITPINSSKDVRFLRWLGVKIPDAVEETILNSNTPLETSLDHFESVVRDLLSVEESLPVDIPMGVNVSPVALRNLDASLALAERLRPLL